MAFNRKLSLSENIPSENQSSDTFGQTSERRRRLSNLVSTSWMNKIKPFIYGAKNDDVPDCYNRVRYIRDSCKVLSDLWKTEKDFLNKSIDSDVSKSFKEFRSSDVARNYRSPYGTNGSPSILNRTIDDFVQIHDYIDSKRKEWFDQIKKLTEQAREKQSTIRQTMTELRDNYEKAQRKLETADSNLKKFQVRSDRLTLPNFEERSRELEDIRLDCEQARTLSRDLYATETYRFANEEHSITVQLFSQYLFEQNSFYNDISKYFSSLIPEIVNRLDDDELTPSFGYDLIKHCSKRIDTTIAYPIETCIRLLQNSFREEGLFRIAPSHGKQKKFVAELDLQSIERGTTLNDLAYDSHVPASTLKQYLRELPECLLTNALLPQWNEAASISNEQVRVQKIGQLIKQLPEINYDNLCYLIRFLARVAEYSSENKMTPSNLGICIGCSILYSKDTSSFANAYTNGSIIVEIMINNHKQLFTRNNQRDQQAYKTQPDLIPTEFIPKSRSVSNENLLETQSVAGLAQPSPGTRRKPKAPPPPPPPQPPPPPSSASSSSSQQSPAEHVTYQHTQSEPNSNEDLTVTSSASFGTSDKVHRRTPSGGTQLDRPGAPPPLPPPVIVVPSPTVQSRRRLSVPLLNNTEQDVCSIPIEDKLIESDTSTDLSSSTNDSVNVGKLISELNNRMAAAKTTNAQTNNIRASSIRNSTITSPGETTDF